MVRLGAAGRPPATGGPCAEPSRARAPRQAPRARGPRSAQPLPPRAPAALPRAQPHCLLPRRPAGALRADPAGRASWSKALGSWPTRPRLAASASSPPSLPRQWIQQLINTFLATPEAPLQATFPTIVPRYSLVFLSSFPVSTSSLPRASYLRLAAWDTGVSAQPQLEGAKHEKELRVGGNAEPGEVQDVNPPALRNS